MNESSTSEKFLGKWNLDVNTPFGKENYSLTINPETLPAANDNPVNASGLITDGKNSTIYSNGRIVDNNFYCSMEVEFPIKAKVLLSLNSVEDKSISGFVQIDNYLKLQVTGSR